jgi:hypothetical protein
LPPRTANHHAREMAEVLPYCRTNSDHQGSAADIDRLPRDGG